MTANLFLAVLLGTYGIGESFLASLPGATCRTNVDCHIGLCDTDHHCRCYVGWTGRHCDHSIVTANFAGVCDHFICSQHGSCQGGKCVCDKGWHGYVCDIHEGGSSLPTPASTTTTTATSTTLSRSTALPATTTRSQGTTASPLHAVTCQKFATISDIGTEHINSNQDAISCASGNKTSPEAFVLEHCNLTSPSTWKEGVNIMANCKSLPLYTPIASFASHHYSSAGTLCGVLIGCLQDGFQIALQHCDQPPIIEHVVTNNGSFIRDPYTYYTIVL